MSMTDPIADMLTRIRNASKAKMKKVDIPASNIKREIARILEENHFIGKTIEMKDNRQGILRVYLRYTKTDDSIIRGIQRVSRPGLRRYLNQEKLVRIDNDMVLHSAAMEKTLGLLREYLKEHGQITMSEFRKLAKTSRKYAVPFMEFCDAAGFTVRNGNFRTLKDVNKG